MRTVIYCDIDGVLHRWPCSPDEMFDPACIARLENVIRPHDARAVITSTWRLEWSLEEIRGKLGLLGPYLIGVTPEIDDPFVKFARYREVLSHWEHYAPSDARWGTIDDESGRYPHLLDNLILTDPRAGFREGDALKLLHLLE
jgi:hypothetical protein